MDIIRHKFWLFILVLMPFCSSAQFEYENISSYNSFHNLIDFNGSLYGFPLNYGTMLEVNLVSGEISEHSRQTGFPLANPDEVVQLDSFIVLLQHDVQQSTNMGLLTFNMNTKTHHFLPLQEILGHYIQEGDSEVEFEDLSEDDETIYIALNGNVQDKYMVLTYSPNAGLDSLDLEGLPREPNESIELIEKSDSKFCAYTSENRFIIWNQDDPSDHFVFTDPDRVWIRILKSNEDNFYYAGYKDGSDSLFMINSVGEIINVMDYYGVSWSGGSSKLEFVNDSICIRTGDRSIFILDTTTHETTLINSETHDLPYGVLDFIPSSDNESLYISSMVPYQSEYLSHIFNLNRTGEFISIESNSKYFTSLLTTDAGWITASGNCIFIQDRNYFFLDETGYHMRPYINPWYQDSRLNPVSFFRQKIEAEDDSSNVYCSLELDYPPSSSYDDTTFFVKIHQDGSHEFLSRDQFLIVKDQRIATTQDYRYQLQNGGLRRFDQESSYIDILKPDDDSITHLLVVQDNLFLSGYSKLYRFHEKNRTYELLHEYSSINPHYELSSDRMGNIYFRNGSALFKLSHNLNEVIEVDISDSIYVSGFFLQHDLNGNIFSRRIGALYGAPFTVFGYISYFNGFEWNMNNNIFNSLPYQQHDYKLSINPKSNGLMIESPYIRNIIECPCRNVDELNDYYEIHDSTEYLELQVNGDFEKLYWDDGSTAFTRQINKPGNYWVKVLAFNGCSNLKTFKVDLVPNATDENESNYGDIIYYFGKDQYPLILKEGLQGDLMIYDMKGALVKEFRDYQNDWIPNIELKNSIMIFTIYNKGERIAKGRILFL